MGMPEIFLEHRKGDKVNKYLRVKPGRTLFLIGSSPEADLRISGEGVVGCHAVLRYREPHWYVCDISGTESVKVNGETTSEFKVDSSAKDSVTTVELAGHKFQLIAKQKDLNIFNDDSASEGNLALHQVVVRLKGRVVESHILPANEAFKFRHGDVEKVLNPPASGHWTRTELGERVIQQRLVGAQEIVKAEKIEFDRDLRKPISSVFAIMVILVGLLALLSKKADEKTEMVLDKKSMDIIFNAKAIKEKRAESRKVVKSARARAGGTNGSQNTANSMPEQSMAPTVSTKGSKALTSLRQSGLSSLVGKIAKRANKQGVMIAAVGVSADQKGSGRAIFSNGTSTVGGGGTASKEGPTYRLGGVGTQGKAGGSGDFRDGTALAGAGVGTGNIVALIDEETVIEGGLDRDVIADVIRRNLGQIRYCYERQLSSNPDLYGKVLVKFTIGATGTVAEPRVDSSTLKSAMVEGCILRRLASWKFPNPKGGTQVRVSYPFLFKALD